MRKKLVRRLLVVVASVGLAAQLVPYGRSHDNPPVIAEPPWPSPQVRALTVRACFDCHSNETLWPWYASVAPVSWLVQHDVDEGRAALNFSEWNRPQAEAKESAEVVTEGEMPPLLYLPMHPAARLSPEETSALASAYTGMFGAAD